MRGERKEQDLRSAEEREARERERERRTREGKKKKERKKESGREECSQWRNFHMERLQVQLFQKTREETPIFFFFFFFYALCTRCKRVNSLRQNHCSICTRFLPVFLPRFCLLRRSCTGVSGRGGEQRGEKVREKENNN